MIVPRNLGEMRTIGAQGLALSDLHVCEKLSRYVERAMRPLEEAGSGVEYLEIQPTFVRAYPKQLRGEQALASFMHVDLPEGVYEAVQDLSRGPFVLCPSKPPPLHIKMMLGRIHRVLFERKESPPFAVVSSFWIKNPFWFKRSPPGARFRENEEDKATEDFPDRGTLFEYDGSKRFVEILFKRGISHSEMFVYNKYPLDGVSPVATYDLSEPLSKQKVFSAKTVFEHLEESDEFTDAG